MPVQEFRKARANFLPSPNKPVSQPYIQEKPDFSADNSLVLFTPSEHKKPLTKISEEDTINEGGSELFLDEDGNLVKVEDYHLEQKYITPIDNFWRVFYARLAIIVVMAFTVLLWLRYYIEDPTNSFVDTYAISVAASLVVTTPIYIWVVNRTC